MGVIPYDLILDSQVSMFNELEEEFMEKIQMPKMWMGRDKIKDPNWVKKEMKTRFKILLVICFFVMFYFALIPGFQICIDSEGDCSIWKELILLTRPVVTSGDDVWHTGDEINSWTGRLKELKILC